MIIAFTATGWADYQTWTTQPKIMRRINRMINEFAREDGPGIGKPERLSHSLSGYWSRRITDEHRLVYAVENDTVTVIAARGHNDS